MQTKPQNSIDETLSTALAHHQAGRLGEAAAGYRTILQAHPHHSDALHLLGIIGQQTGQLDYAIDLIKAAIHQNPSVAHYHHNLGNTFLQKGSAKEAFESYRQAVLLKPDYFEAHHGIGNALMEFGELEAAVEAYQSSIQLQPAFASAYYNLGRALSRLERTEEAIRSYRIAIQLDGNHVEALFNLGGLLFQQKNYAEAEDAYKQALTCRPKDAEVRNYLGRVLAAQNKQEEAIHQFETAISLRPEYSEAYSNLGLAYLQGKDCTAAEEVCRKAVQLTPSSANAHFSLGNVFREQYKHNEAIACYRRAKELAQELPQKEEMKSAQWQIVNNLALTLNEEGRLDEALACYEEGLVEDPENAQLHLNHAFTLLMSGKFDRGWLEHEWRWQAAVPQIRQRHLSYPRWNGENLHGAKILLWGEQGFGDTIQFVRYASMVADFGGEVILEVPPRLVRLLRGVPGVHQVLATGDPLPTFDYQCPLMSLPLVFKTELDTIPGSVPYLKVTKKDIEQERGKWPGRGLRVGLAWKGNPQNVLDSYRSIPLQALAALGRVSDTSFCSLHVGEANRDISVLNTSFPIAEACAHHRDFADTAALIAGLDLVISVDTSIAHLAGALGVPLWVLLAKSRADWRWLRNRSDSPWYPSARLFRQPVDGDWSGLAALVQADLQRLAEAFLVTDSEFLREVM